MTRWLSGQPVFIVPSCRRVFAIVPAPRRCYLPYAFATSAQFTTFHHALM